MSPVAVLSVMPNPEITFAVAFEDAHLAVVSKRAGLVTQPGKGHESDALLNGLFARWGVQLQNLGAARDFGLLHRLDRETSGLLAVGLSREGYDGLRTQFETRLVRKFYYAIVTKAPRQPDGVIERAIAETEPKKMGEKKLARIAAPGRGREAGKPAVTAFRVLASSDRAALLECRPLTGRLHQVRVHLESIGCPILGDGLYAPGAVAGAAPRLALHAHRLAFTHPVTGAAVDVRSPMPKELKGVLRRMGLPTPGELGEAAKGGGGRDVEEAPDDE